MTLRARRGLSGVACLATMSALSLAFAAKEARADDTIRTPGDHPIYRFEAEPHVIWGWDRFDSGGIGIGGRFSFPILDNGFVSTINNSVAITVGFDWVHYTGACFVVGCLVGGNVDYIYIPVAMQWNFYVAKHWSVFGEPGLAIVHGFYNDFACHGLAGCGGYNFPLDLVLYLGGRYHINNHFTAIARIGYPDFTFGVSFM